MSDDFKEGYQQGFQDGYNLGKKGWQQPTVPNPFTDIPGWKPKQDWLRTEKVGTRCSVCDMFFEYGKSYGYVCGHAHCPSRITCGTFTNFTGLTGSIVIKDPGPADGLSYEEIYGSVIYQQNNKKEE